MEGNEMADRCELCGKKLVFRNTIQRVECDVSRRAKAGIEDMREYRRDGEAETDFIARLEEQCPQCHAMLVRPGVPGELGCPECEWTNPNALRNSPVIGTVTPASYGESDGENL